MTNNKSLPYIQDETNFPILSFPVFPVLHFIFGGERKVIHKLHYDFGDRPRAQLNSMDRLEGGYREIGAMFLLHLNKKLHQEIRIIP